MLKTTWVSAVQQFLPPAPSLPSRVALHGSLDIFTLAGWPRLRGVSALIKGAIVVTAFLGLLPATAHGELVYVSDLGANAVVVKDSSNGNEVARIAVARPIGIALNSTTRRGYISASGSAAVYVIDLDTNAVIPPAISVGGGPQESALNEQTNRLYVANYAGGYVSVINTATNTLITNVSTGSLPFSVAVVKNTDKAYVANRNNVAEVDGLTNTVTRYFPLASANTGDITYASTVNKLFTADADAETVSVINLSTGAVSAVSLGRTPIRGFGPQGVAFDPGTNRVIVSTGDGWLVAIDATTEQIVASVRVATELQRLRISPSTRRIYAPSGTGTVYMVDADSLAPAGALTGFVNAGYAVAAPSAINSPSELAKQVVGGDYQLRAKGWDWKGSRFVEPDVIKTSGYHWNSDNFADIDNVLDCSGLVFWSYNKAFGATKYQVTGNPMYYEGADGQYRNNTVAVSESDLKPGDLLFFDFEAPVGVIDHVAMYVGCCGPGGADVVHASSRKVGIIWSHKDALKKLSGFVGYGRVTTPQVGIRFAAHSPIGLVVTDPDGFTITPDTVITTSEELLREVPGILYYSESNTNGNTSLDAAVSAPTLKTGFYLVRVVPKADAVPTDIYSLDVEAAGKTISLAQNVPIQNIPSAGYGVASTGSDITVFIPVSIDIKPGGTPNSINSTSRGKIPVAILSSASFNAPGRIASASLTFGRTGDESSLSFCNQAGEDVNGDGLPDLICHFDTSKIGFRIGDTRGILKGKTLEGVPVIGTDSVRIVK